MNTSFSNSSLIIRSLLILCACLLVSVQGAVGQSTNFAHTNQGGMSEDPFGQFGADEDECVVTIYEELFGDDQSHASDPIASDRGTCERPLLTGGCRKCTSKSKCVDCCQDHFEGRERRGCISGCDRKWGCIGMVFR